MSDYSGWLISWLAYPTPEQEVGRDHNPDGLKALAEYMSGAIDVQEAARQITAPVSDEDDQSELWRLWSLLLPIVVNEPQDRQKIMDLIAAIVSLPATPNLDWQRYPLLWFTWSEHYLGHMIGPENWELLPCSKADVARRRDSYLASGSAAASLYVRGLGVTALWGYQAISVLSWERPGIEVFLGEIYAWLTVAAAQLKRDMRPEEVEQFMDKDGGQLAATMEEHWERWTKKLYELCEEGSTLSEQGRSMARACFEYMLMDSHDSADGSSNATGVRWTENER